MQNIKQVILFIIIINSSVLISQDPDLFTSSSNGVWDNTLIWNSSGADSDGIPDSDDTVVISHAITCSSTSTSLVSVLKINSASSLTLDPTYRLQIWGADETSVIDGSITGTGLINIIRNHTITGSGTISNATLQVNNWSLVLDISASINACYLVSGGGLKLNSGNTLTINGDFIKYNASRVINNQGTFIINDPNFMTTYETPSEEFLSSLGSIQYNTTGNFPVPFDGGYNNVTISGIVTCDGDLNITGEYVNTGTFTSSNNDNITFNGTSAQTISGSGVSNFKNLILNNSNGLSIDGGTVNIEQVFELQSGNVSNTSASVVLESDVDNTAGQLDLGSSSYLGGLTVERYVSTSSQGYRMFGSPVQSTTLADWQDDGVIFTGFTGSDYPTFGWTSSYTYDESQATNLNKEAGWVESTNITNSTTPSSGTWIYTDVSTYKLSVTGVPNQGDRTISVQCGGATDQRGWNLMTNPYPCNLDWDLFYSDNTGVVDDAYWVYDADAGNNVFYSGSGGGSLTSIISHSQGIWVHKSAVGSSSVTFKQSHLSTTSTSYVKSTNGINEPLNIKISGDINGYHDFSFIKAVSNATSNFDQGLDVFKFFTPLPDYAPNVYVVSDDGFNLGAALINNNQSIDIPIGVEIGSLAHGNYTLDFSNLNQFMIGSCITLEDLETSVITDLRLDSTYTFVSNSSSISPRFIIHITIDYDITVSNENCFVSNDGSILLTGSNINGSAFKLFSNNVILDSLIAVNNAVTYSGISAGIYEITTDHVGSCTMINQDIIVTQPNQPVIASFDMNKDTIFLDQSGEVIFNNLSTGSISYLWDFGDGNLSTDLNPIHTYLNQGIYPVMLYADNENTGVCTDLSIKNIIVLPTDPTGLNDFSNSFSSKIYQNQGQLIINYENEYFDYCYLTDISGKILTNKVHRVNGQNEIELNINGFSPGIYFVIFENTFGVFYTKKFFLN